ncbi:tetratricopeptide repeat protein [Lysinibacillus sp. NPDC056959]|uniref:tetratricopeptide repeat protein n=1 Tax=Lysinibacillus sp. NPDC056959 TaxID=3345981 RepID=UPI003625261E
MDIGHKIKLRRKELGLRQSDLAEPEFTRGFISQIENGITKPPLKTLEIIATKLAVSINYLIEEESKDSVDFTTPHKVSEKIKIAKRLINLKKYEDASSIIETIEKMSNPDFMGDVLALKGEIFYEQQQYQDAITLLEQSLIYLHPKDPIANIDIYVKLADSYMNGQKYDKAIDHGFYGLSIIQSNHYENQLFELKLLYILGYCHCRRSEYKQGIRYVEEALSLSDVLQIHYNYGSLKMLRGIAHTYLKDYEKGIRYTKEALLFFKSINAIPEVVGCLTNLGILYRFTYDYEQAIHFLKESLTVAEEAQLHYHKQNSLYELAETHLVAHQYKEALYLAEESLQLIREKRLRGKIFYILASTHASLTNWAEAITYTKQALKLFEEQNMKRWQAKSLTKLAEIYYSQGEHQASHIHYQKSHEVYESLMEAE